MVRRMKLLMAVAAEAVVTGMSGVDRNGATVGRLVVVTILSI